MDIQEKKSKGQKLPENKAKAFNTLRSKAQGLKVTFVGRERR